MSTKPHWTYEDGAEPPEEWGALDGYATCSSGQSQTPIDIPAATAAASATKPTFVGYGQIPLTVEQNGHTIQVDYAAKGDGTDPHFDFGGKTYVLAQFHLHSPSEHHVDGKSYSGELHMVHKAADGSIAVVGVFIDESAANGQLENVLANAPPPTTTTTCTGATVDLAQIVPTSGTLYNYSGSLTTPPCTEGLTWFVSAKPITWSAAQHDDFVSQTSETTNRPIQPLNGRAVSKISM